MSRGPVLTVVVPTFNRGEVLGRALASLAPGRQRCDEQSYEVIVVDGGSEDCTQAVLATAAASFSFRSVVRPPRGVYDAINTGVRLGRGSHFAWVNSDDELAPGSLAAVLSLLKRQPDTEVISGTARIRSHPAGATLRVFGDSFTASLSISGVTFGHPIPNARVYARRLWDEVGPFEPTLRVAADRDWLLRLAARGVVERRVDSYTYDYWQYPTSLTMSGARATPQHRQEYVTIGQQHLQRYSRLSAKFCILRAWRALHELQRRRALEETSVSWLVREMPWLAVAVMLKSVCRLIDAVTCQGASRRQE